MLLRRDRDRDISTRLRLGHRRQVNRGCPTKNTSMKTITITITPAWTPATAKSQVSEGHQRPLNRRCPVLDTRDLMVAGVRISISPKYLYLYLELTGSTLST